MNYKLLITKQGKADLEKLRSLPAALNKAKKLLEVLQDNPLQIPPPYEKLSGDLAGFYSRRINIQHRLVYQVREETKEVVVIRMWTHYE